MIKITEQNNVYAKKLMKAFSQFKRMHWKPSHVQELKPSEFMVLHTVKHAFIDGDKSGLMVSEISNHLNIARPTVTQLVNGLERKGFLVKMPDDCDKRVVRIHLSDKGKELAKKGAEDFYCRFKGLAEKLGKKKSTELSDLLQEVFEYFQETEKTKG